MIENNVFGYGMCVYTVNWRFNEFQKTEKKVWYIEGR